MTEGGLEQINAATDKLTSASHKLAEAMYKAQGPTPDGGAAGAAAGAGPGGASQGGEKNDNVVDAVFVDVDEKK
jgi:molecular chaperone DnaK